MGKTICRYYVNNLIDYFVWPDRTIYEDLFDQLNLIKLLVWVRGNEERV